MASVFSLFSCCLHRRVYSDSETTPNEHSHLIPATTESDPTSSSPNAFVVDHQKMKERMSHIVRSKEGKMVNVNSRLPFNLHNKKLSVTMDSESPGHPSLHSSSRSASTSTMHRPSLNLVFSPLSNSSSSSSGHVQAHVGAPLVASPAAGASANTIAEVSRSSSLASRETSNHDHESDKSVRRPLAAPILNLRLVRGLALSRPPDASSQGIAATRRGRAKRKAGDDGNETMNDGSLVADRTHPRSPLEVASAPPAGAGEGSLSTSVESTTVDERTPRLVDHDHDSDMQSSLVIPAPMPIPNPNANPTLSISPASTIAFKLQDTGPLIVSWGD